jgi:hypothetical protein
MRPLIKRALPVAVLAAALASPSLFAQPAGNKAAAEALFREGKRLMGEKKYAEACPKFADSQRLDPAAGTLLNLAACYEANGQIATAWATYGDAAAAAKNEQNPAYQGVAEKRGAALESKLSKLTITADGAAEGTEIRRDGVVISRTEWGLAIPVDPGKHTIEATAPKKKPWSKSVDVGPDGAKESVTIPTLEDAPVDVSVTPSASTSATAVPTITVVTTPATVDHPGSTQRVLGWSAVAVGVIGLGLGTYFSIHAKSQYNDSLGANNANCPVDKNVCNATGVSLRNDARTSGTIATVALGAGGVLAVAGAILVLTAPSSKSPPTTGRVTILPTLGGAVMQGAW